MDGHWQAFNAEDSQSKIVGYADDFLVEVEIEGKVKIYNALSPEYLDEVKDSLEDSFADAKNDLVSSISAEAVYRDISPRNPTARLAHNIEIEGNSSRRKHKAREYEGRKMAIKLSRQSS